MISKFQCLIINIHVTSTLFICNYITRFFFTHTRTHTSHHACFERRTLTHTHTVSRILKVTHTTHSHTHTHYHCDTPTHTRAHTHTLPVSHSTRIHTHCHTEAIMPTLRNIWHWTFSRIYLGFWGDGFRVRAPIRQPDGCDRSDSRKGVRSESLQGDATCILDVVQRYYCILKRLYYI